MSENQAACIHQAFLALREQGRIHGNFFLSADVLTSLLQTKPYEFFQGNKSCCLLVQEDGFRRAYFGFAEGGEKELPRLKARDGKAVVIDLLGTAKQVEKLEAALPEKWTKKELGEFVYMHCIEPQSLEGPAIDCTRLNGNQEEEAFMRIWANFDAFTEHLPSREELRGLIEDLGSFCILDEKGQTSAFLLAETKEQMANLRLLWVTQDQRGRGLAKALLNRYHEATRGCQSHTLWVRKGNTNAQRLYEQVGYQVSSRMYKTYILN